MTPRYRQFHAFDSGTGDVMASFFRFTIGRKIYAIIGLAFVRMTRERFLPLEENPVSRGVSQVYAPVLSWAIGLDKRVPFRVQVLDSPARLVVDFDNS